MRLGLDGKVVMVTGAARGIGEGTARAFADEGATVVVADVRDDLGAAVAADLGDRGSFLHLDVTETGEWDDVVATVLDRHGSLDVLVNNAGSGIGGPIDVVPVADHQRLIDLNLNGVYYGMRAVAAPMRAQGAGAIVNISSIDGLAGIAWLTTYVATKFAVTGMTRAVALELGPSGIRVNSVHPGFIETPLLGEAGKVRLEPIVATQPIARFGRPEDVAAAVVYLASDAASFVTGTQLVVDGGHLAGPWRPPHEG